MPGRGTETRRMPRSAYVRLGDGLAGRVRAAAEADGITDAAWLRRLAAVAVDADPTEARPVRRKRPVPPPPAEHVRAMVALQEVVAELGGSLVKAAVRTREAGHAALHDEIEMLIPGIKKASADLVAIILEAPR